MNKKHPLLQTLFQVIGKGASALSSLLVAIVIGNMLGVSSFGDFVKIVSFVGLFYPLVDLGMNAIILRKSDEEKDFSSFAYTRMLYALVFIAICSVAVIFLPYEKTTGIGFSPMVKTGIMIYSFTLVTQAMLLSSAVIFQKERSYEKQMITSILAASVMVIVVVLATASKSLIVTVFAACLGNIVSGIFSMVFIRNYLHFPKINPTQMWRLLKESFPLGIMLLCNLVYFRVDVLILSVLKGSADVGVYGFAYRFFDFAVAISLFVSNGMYPQLLESLHNRAEVKKITVYYLKLGIGISFIIVFVGLLLSPFISVFSKNFAASMIPFQVLLLSLPLFFITSILQWLLIAQKQISYLLIIYVVSGIINVCLNLVFIPSGSYIAAAVITGASEAIVLGFLLLKFSWFPKNIQNLRLI